MIYSCNTLGFYTVQNQRQYDSGYNEKVIHHFETNKIPSFQIIVDSSISSCTYSLYDINNTLITSGSTTVESTTNEAGTSYSRIIRKEVTTTGNSDGFYYLELTYTGGTLYSDVFCWQTDVSEYLKVSVVSSDVQIGQFNLNLSDFTYKVYLDAKNATYEYEIDEEGIEKTYGNLPLFNSRNKINEFEITGYKVTLDFLAALRIFWTNGTVTLTYKGDEFEIYDMENPEKKDNFGYSDVLVITLRFKRKDYLQSINEL